MKRVPLRNSRGEVAAFAVVDDDDFERVIAEHMPFSSESLEVAHG